MTVLTLVSVGVTGFVANRILERGLEAHGLDEVRRDVDALAGEFASVVETSKQDVASLAGMLPDATDPRADAAVLAMLRAKPAYLQVRVIDGQGFERARADRMGPDGAPRLVPRADLQDKSDRRYTKRALALEAGTFDVSPIELNIENGKVQEPQQPVLRISTPLGDGGSGFAIVNVDLRPLSETVRHPPENDARLQLLKPDGSVIISDDPTRDFGDQLDRTAHIQDLYSDTGDLSQGSRVVSDATGAEHFLALHTLELGPDNAVVFALLAPERLFRSTATSVRHALAVAMLAAIAAGIVVALFLGNSLARPIVRITEAIQDFRGGRLGRLPPNQGGEIGALSQAVGVMAEEIGKVTAALQSEMEGHRAAAERAAEFASRERLYRAAVENAEDCIMLLDSEGRILSWNRAAERLYGWTSDEIIGRSSEILAPPAHVDEIGRSLRQIQAGNRVDQFETVRVTKDGRLVDVAVALSPVFDADGRLIGASKIARDISDRKRAEERIAETNATLERSNAELEQFAYVAAHDLQEPLRMVASYTELLAERYEGQLDERADKYIGYAVDGAKRMKRLVSDLLSYSRVQTQGKALEPVDMQAVIEGALTEMGPAIAAAGAVVEVAEMPRVMGDAGQLRQVMTNLLSNAIKFRGEVPPHVSITAVPRDDRTWRISVADNGIGIDPQYADIAFQMFQRLQTRETHDGNGIGLAISRKIIERHGGEIWFDPAPKGGTIFRFTLPKAPGGNV